ncbi:MAG: FecCD family ABC transporter permease [Rubrivivax sp.]
MSAASLALQYRRQNRRRFLLIVLLLGGLLLSLCADIATGPAGLGIMQVLRGLVWPETLSLGEQVIVFDVRLPYALMALAVGGALGLGGVQMQTVLNNPLASPFTLGLAAAATLGASIGIVLQPQLPGLPTLATVPLLAFACALLVTSLTLLLARWHGGGGQTLVLFGIAMLFALEALVWLMQFLADTNTLDQLVFWSMGSLNRANWWHVGLVSTAALLGLLAAMRHAWALTLLRGGEAHAASLGVQVESVRWRVMVEVSLLSALALCFVGTIGFVGLVGPHIARLLVGEQHRFLLPASMLAGALMLSLASIASKAIVPGLVIPIGIVTALVGVPVFMALLLRQRSSA